jgi:hypothetical protein
MVSYSALATIALVYLGFTCLLGGLSGMITSYVLRLRWKPVVFLQDMAISGVTSLLFALVVTEVEVKRLPPIERGEVHHSFWTFVSVGFAAPVIRHLVRLIWLRSNSAASQVK